MTPVDLGLRRDAEGNVHLLADGEPVAAEAIVTIRAGDLAAWAVRVFDGGLRVAHPRVRRSIERDAEGKVSAFIEEAVL